MSSRNGNGVVTESDDFVLTFDEVADVDARQYEDVPIPEWGVGKNGKPKRVRVGSMSAEDRRWFVKMGTVPNPADPTGVYIRNAEWYDDGHHDVELLTRSCLKPDGTPLFTRNQWRKLQESGPAPMVRLVAAAMRVSILDDETWADMRKNFSTPNATQTIDSQWSSAEVVPV